MKMDSVTCKSTPKNDMERLFPVLFMLLSFGIMVVCLGLVLFFQHRVTYAVCASLYAALAATEFRFQIKSPISISMLALYIGLSILNYYTNRYTGYEGVIIFSWLSIITVFLLLQKKPFTAFYSNNKSIIQLHYAVSSLWGIAYILSLLASSLLMPNISFIIIPYVLCIFCGLVSIFLNLVWFGKCNEFQPNFAIGDLSFRRITPASSTFSHFCNFYAQQIYRPGADGNEKTEREIADVIKNVETTLGKASYIFIAEHEMKIIGCFRCVVDLPGYDFPLEKDIQYSFDPLRRFGKLLYAGRLAVDPVYRERPDVLNGLFKCFIDLAFSKDISFVISDGFADRLPTYLKLGFEILFERSDPRHAARMGHGYICYPVYLNFSSLIFYRDESTQEKHLFEYSFNRYLAERWYKRNALRHIFKPSSFWPWRFSMQQIRTILCLPNERKVQ